MNKRLHYAPGWPGIEPRWTSSAKCGIGTALNPASRLYFTLSHGIFNEIYYPRPDQACTRDMGMLVTDGSGYFSDEKRDCLFRVEQLAPGVPAYRLENTSRDNRYRIEKEILSDPWREVVLQHTRFVPLRGGLLAYHVHVLLAPHIGNRGRGNTAWIDDYKGVPMLFAERDGTALALACSAAWVNRSAGFVGESDGWQDLFRHKQMMWTFNRAENGNVALMAEVDMREGDGQFLLALGFGGNASEAGNRARASLADGFDNARHEYIAEWQSWQKRIRPSNPEAADPKGMYLTSAAVLRIHEAKNFPGALTASLSIPWGAAKGDDDLGGYHLAWPRDLAESAGGLLAAGACEDVRRVLYYLQSTQEPDGHWPQNMWLDGTSYWSGLQMDETAFPILLTDLARREKALDAGEQKRLWPMIRQAAAFLVRNGPVTQQDRWEEDPGYSPFTLAAEISALLAAADLADLNDETEAAGYLREVADAWNDSIEKWIYTTGTDLAEEAGVEGYYVRIAPPEVSDASSPAGGFVTIKNRPPGMSMAEASEIVSPDALALVRFGLRSPDDPRIRNTVAVIDRLLRVDTSHGPAWHRYNDDGYGEHEDGSAFDGTGIGRAWPLITGERAHFELAAGRRDAAEKLLKAMEAFSNDEGLIPEQIWDSPDIPERELFFGRPSGSAMPLVWAHAEYVKLCRSLHDGRVFDMPPQAAKRYIVEKKRSPHTIWRFNHKCRTMKEGRTLRIELLSRGIIHWSADRWRTTRDTATRSPGFEIHLADLPTTTLPAGTAVAFTIYWPESSKWEGTDFSVVIAPDD